jgi:hypothetical protein
MVPAFRDAFLGGIAETFRLVRERGRVTGFRVTGGWVRNVEFIKRPIRNPGRAPPAASRPQP